jgi:hypothetical protein
MFRQIHTTSQFFFQTDEAILTDIRRKNEKIKKLQKEESKAEGIQFKT